jgi:polar amino acid transport system substrate-binding protein
VICINIASPHARAGGNNMLSRLLSAALLVALPLSSAQGGESFVLNTSFGIPLASPNHQGALNILYRELGRNLGVDIQVQLLPAERALLNANAGIEDGDACRISGLEKAYPNLIQVHEGIFNFKISAFAKRADIKLNGPDSLKPYHVGYLIGWKILEKNVGGAKSATGYASDIEMFIALENEEIDIAFIEKAQGLSLLQKRTRIHQLKPPFLEAVCYLHLHKKHQHLIPKILTELNKMKLNGKLNKVFNEAMHPYLNGEAY